MASTPEEWFRQADYDMDTADYMLAGGRNVYAVFMCHLSIEKALKGIYHKRLGVMPPKIHNLLRLLDTIKLTPPEEYGRFLVRLNAWSVVTRYPEDILGMAKEFPDSRVGALLKEARSCLRWIQEQF